MSAPREQPGTAPGSRPVIDDDWQALRRHTAARIALGRSGASLPSREVLAFSLAHAQARDAVHLPLDVAALERALDTGGWRHLSVHSRAADRSAYLARPDWGRRLAPDSAVLLEQAATEAVDAAFVISDGLSSTAIQRHALPFLGSLRPLLQGLTLAPIVVATQARVALADEVGALMRARLAVSLIGERPGLSSPDSLGIYLSFAPRVGLTDEARNCISNIRPEGLAYDAAAQLLAAMMRAALKEQKTGVALRFDSRAALLPPAAAEAGSALPP